MTVDVKVEEIKRVDAQEAVVVEANTSQLEMRESTMTIVVRKGFSLRPLVSVTLWTPALIRITALKSLEK